MTQNNLKIFIMKNLKKLSRKEMKTLNGGAAGCKEPNCHCGGNGIKPPASFCASSPAACGGICYQYAGC
ncbi:bacteriocin-like protein [Chryseobacterium sp. R2A-55]|uniref:bacteriocin-like protein n=1 Tax=Chryseobacterium sp. R2A-55 TaxID=2744445 RepID=UPI001F23736D|nr:hypothetical protein [Chryseobacterium sp. R2A-55]